jgi:hypothetical protein
MGCLSNMLDFAVGTGNFKEIKCPAAVTQKCTGVLDGKDVQVFANRETYKKCALIIYLNAGRSMC